MWFQRTCWPLRRSRASQLDLQVSKLSHLWMFVLWSYNGCARVKLHTCELFVFVEWHRRIFQCRRPPKLLVTVMKNIGKAFHPCALLSAFVV